MPSSFAMSKTSWLILGAIISPLLIGFLKLTVFVAGIIAIIWALHVLREVLNEEN